MTRKRFHGLKKAKIRASWNKYNLYNLSRYKSPIHPASTFFQQKWKSKSSTRMYHGEMMREKQWQRMFTSKLDAVIPMDHRYLAEYDGSELATGRGSGKEIDISSPETKLPRKVQPVPYMNMIYAPMERRLDMAIFRALFASSHRQARQMVVHGQVKVNGQTMRYPSYLLNPGDMFQVEIDSVMYATGAVKSAGQRKEKKESGGAIRRQRALKAKREIKDLGAARRKAARDAAIAEGKERPSKRERPPPLDDYKVERKAVQRELEHVVEEIHTCLDRIKSRGDWKRMKKGVVSALHKKGKTPKRHRLIQFGRIVSDSARRAYRLPMEELEELRTKLIRRWLQMEEVLPKEAKTPERRMVIEQNRMKRWQAKKQLTEEVATGMKVELAKLPKEKRKEEAKKIRSKPEFREKLKQQDEKVVLPSVLEQSTAAFREALARARENPKEEKKPYATPWEPRPYMSAFAFVPRYLEVNHTICSAVYLRHPVARPGLAEVPSPFPADDLQLAFNWYLRRR